MSRSFCGTREGTTLTRSQLKGVPARVVVVDGLLYVMSGWSADRGDLGTLVERYDPAADVWEAVARTPHAEGGVGVVPDMQYALLAI